MTRIRILPYKSGSRSAKALATALGGKVLRLEGSTFVSRNSDLIINWGNSSCSFPLALNASVSEASDKLKFFYRMKDCDYSEIIPTFWTNQEDIPDSAFPIVCRTILSGHSGAGIVVANTRDDLVQSPLYVKYIKKEDEYRVHVGNRNGDYTTSNEHDFVTIAVQRKARRLDVEEPNWQIRNHANGFVFVRQNVNPPPSVLEVARKALEATGLDFGAVDVIWNAHQERAYVLECNTAPGLEGTSIEDYKKFFQEFM